MNSGATAWLAARPLLPPSHEDADRERLALALLDAVKRVQVFGTVLLELQDRPLAQLTFFSRIGRRLHSASIMWMAEVDPGLSRLSHVPDAHQFLDFLQALAAGACENRGGNRVFWRRVRALKFIWARREVESGAPFSLFI